MAPCLISLELASQEKKGEVSQDPWPLSNIIRTSLAKQNSPMSKLVNSTRLRSWERTCLWRMLWSRSGGELPFKQMDLRELQNRGSVNFLKFWCSMSGENQQRRILSSRNNSQLRITPWAKKDWAERPTLWETIASLRVSYNTRKFKSPSTSGRANSKTKKISITSYMLSSSTVTIVISQLYRIEIRSGRSTKGKRLGLRKRIEIRRIQELSLSDLSNSSQAVDSHEMK